MYLGKMSSRWGMAVWGLCLALSLLAGGEAFAGHNDPAPLPDDVIAQLVSDRTLTETPVAAALGRSLDEVTEVLGTAESDTTIRSSGPPPPPASTIIRTASAASWPSPTPPAGAERRSRNRWDTQPGISTAAQEALQKDWDVYLLATAAIGKGIQVVSRSTQGSLYFALIFSPRLRQSPPG